MLALTAVARSECVMTGGGRQERAEVMVPRPEMRDAGVSLPAGALHSSEVRGVVSRITGAPGSVTLRNALAHFMFPAASVAQYFVQYVPGLVVSTPGFAVPPVGHSPLEVAAAAPV